MQFGVGVVRWTVFMLVPVAMAAAAAADIIYLDSGGFIAGEIINEDDDQVIVKTNFGQIPVSKEQINLIERGTTEEIFQRRFERMNKGDYRGYLNLAWWAKNVRPFEEAQQAFKDVVRLKPNNRDAREELGYIEHEGQWLTFGFRDPNPITYIPGEVHKSVFVHELLHQKDELPDHYGSKTYCIMHATPPFFSRLFYDKCWNTMIKKYPGMTRPKVKEDTKGDGTIYLNKDQFGNPPETKITIKNN